MLGGQGGGALLTVVERKSRFACIARLPSKQSEVVAEALIEILRPYKKQVETVTVDNGNGFDRISKSAKPSRHRSILRIHIVLGSAASMKMPSAYCGSIFPRELT